MKRLLLIFLLCLTATFGFSQTAPVFYVQFDGSTPLANTVGSGAFTGGGTYNITPSQVVTALTWSSNAGSFIQGPSLTGNDSVTVQFLFKSNYETVRGRNNQMLTWGGISISFQYPYIQFATPGSGNNTQFNLYGINKRSWDYLFNDEWHHLAFVFGGGTKQVWIDGQKLFSAACSTGTVTGAPAVSNGTNNYAKVRGSIDEFAIYTVRLSDRQIYKNYLDFVAGNHYTTALAPAYVPGPDSTGTIDPLEYTLDIPREYQLGRYPAPRYKPGNTLLKNFNWMDPTYMGGATQPGITNTQAAANSVIIQSELVKNWNYYLSLSRGNGIFDTSWAGLANRNPTWKLSTITFRAQPTSMLLNQTLPNADYLQNSFGQFLNANGAIVTSPNKIWRPTAPTADYIADGQDILSQMDNLYTRISRPLDMVNENGEIFPVPDTVTALPNDPACVTSKNASGWGWNKWLANKFMLNETQAYRNVFMAKPILATTKFTEFSIDGFPPIFDNFEYSEARKVGSLINGQYYSTSSIYTRWPDNWRYWQAASHGWQWMVESRVHEIALGDKLCSPFVAAGWDRVDSLNIRPAQWLGLLKVFSAAGAEFYYASFFNITTPKQDSKLWMYQAAMPSYAQAITSRVENYLRSGDLMAGDIPVNWTGGTNPGYNFYTGKANTIVAARKITGQNKYYIAATIQPLTNQEGGTPLIDTVAVVIGGDSLQFEVRRQGSCYIYDKTVSPSVFYQLDKWHQYEHPSRWDNDFYFEGEVNDGGTNTIRTTATGTNYTNYTSYITGTAQYAFLPRDTADYWLYIRARSDSAVQINATIGSTSFDLCVDSTAYTWIRFSTDSVKVKWSLTGVNQTLNLSTGTARVDQLVMSHDSALFATNYFDCDTVTPPPVCTWVVGAWSAFGAACTTGYTYRTRSVTSSLSGCTPPPPVPASLDSMVCVCGWVVGNWSAFGNCNAGYQYRFRTVTSSMVGCVPAATMPAVVDSQACSCVWVAGAWSAWGPCNGVYQLRTRTVTTSLTGCTPVGPAPASSDTLSCTIPPPTCSWSAGPWSPYSPCVAGSQFRTRTVTSTVIGCTPTTPKPDTVQTQSCTTPTVLPPPGTLSVSMVRWWYYTKVSWTYAVNPTLFYVELIQQGQPAKLYSFSGSTRSVTYWLSTSLKSNTTYTFRIRAFKDNIYSTWSSITFTTTW